MERPDGTRLQTWQDFLYAHSRLLGELEHELTEATGLSVAQYNVLLRLSQAPDRKLRMVDLSAAVLYTTGGVTRLIDRMAAAGWVAREPSPTDRRAVLATLTPAGLELLREPPRSIWPACSATSARCCRRRTAGGRFHFLGRLARPAGGPDSAPGCDPDEIPATEGQ